MAAAGLPLDIPPALSGGDLGTPHQHGQLFLTSAGLFWLEEHDRQHALALGAISLTESPPCLTIPSARQRIVIRIASCFHTVTFWEFPPDAQLQEVRDCYLDYLCAVARAMDREDVLPLLRTLTLMGAGTHAFPLPLASPLGYWTTLIGLRFACLLEGQQFHLMDTVPLQGTVFPFHSSAGLELSSHAGLLQTAQGVLAAMVLHLCTTDLYTGLQACVLPRHGTGCGEHPLTWTTLLAYVHNPGRPAHRAIWPYFEARLLLEGCREPAPWYYHP